MLVATVGFFANIQIVGYRPHVEKWLMLVAYTCDVTEPVLSLHHHHHRHRVRTLTRVQCTGWERTKSMQVQTSLRPVCEHPEHVRHQPWIQLFISHNSPTWRQCSGRSGLVGSGLLSDRQSVSGASSVVHAMPVQSSVLGAHGPSSPDALAPTHTRQDCTTSWVVLRHPVYGHLGRFLGVDWKWRTWKWPTKWQDVKMHDMKLRVGKMGTAKFGIFYSAFLIIISDLYPRMTFPVVINSVKLRLNDDVTRYTCQWRVFRYFVFLRSF